MDMTQIAKGKEFNSIAGSSGGYVVTSYADTDSMLATIQERLGVAPLVDFFLKLNAELSEYRCTCGKLLFKGVLFLSAIEIKCKRCGEIRRIHTADKKSRSI